jgi:hypothetical protein
VKFPLLLSNDQSATPTEQKAFSYIDSNVTARPLDVSRFCEISIDTCPAFVLVIDAGGIWEGNQLEFLNCAR